MHKYFWFYLYFPPKWSLAYTGQLNRQILCVLFTFGKIFPSVKALAAFVFITRPECLTSTLGASL